MLFNNSYLMSLKIHASLDFNLFNNYATTAACVQIRGVILITIHDHPLWLLRMEK